MRIVVTGGPCSGKSTLISKINHEGQDPKDYLKIVDEVARGFFSFLTEFEPDRLTDRDYIQKSIETRQLENWTHNSKAVFDRGLPDELGYREFYGLTIPQSLVEKCEKYRYDKVFFLPYWDEIYQNDSIRKETKKQAQRLEQLLIKGYERVGYELITVPKLSVEERIDYIYHQLLK